MKVMVRLLRSYEYPFPFEKFSLTVPSAFICKITSLLISIPLGTGIVIVTGTASPEAAVLTFVSVIPSGIAFLYLLSNVATSASLVIFNPTFDTPSSAFNAAPKTLIFAVSI